ncbi:MAG: class I SAM-dependent methyltransferase [Tepidisphaeraceae bacterium]|jgi:ubiquinone/menaquinone biosynthesis C-methylase UbiE
MPDEQKSFILLSEDAGIYKGWEDYYKAESDAAWGHCPPPFLEPSISPVLKSGMSVADYGAGDGRNSLALAKAGVALTLVDISAAGLQRAAKRSREIGLQPLPTLVTASLEQLPLASGQFDFAICIDALPQIHRPRVALEEMARTLIAGGILVTNVFTPRDAAFGQGAALSARTYLFKNTLFSFWEEAEFRPLLQGIFDVLDCQAVRWDDPAHGDFRPYPHTHDALVFTLRKT